MARDMETVPSARLAQFGQTGAKVVGSPQQRQPPAAGSAGRNWCYQRAVEGPGLVVVEAVVLVAWKGRLGPPP